jgi:hypothetical protein
MIVPPDRVKRSTRAIDYGGVVTSGCDRSHRLFTLETRSEVLAIVPLSTLSSKIHNTYTAPVTGRLSIARLIGVVEIVKVSVDL